MASRPPRPAPSSVSRRSWAGTREAYAQPLAATAAAVSPPVSTAGSAPASSDRTSTWRPATWLTGRQHSQRWPGTAPIRRSEARAEASSAAADSWVPLGGPVDPEVAITTATSGGTPPSADPAGPGPGSGFRWPPSGSTTADGRNAPISSASRAAGRLASSGSRAGPVPSSAAASAATNGPVAVPPGSRTACRARDVTE